MVRRTGLRDFLWQQKLVQPAEFPPQSPLPQDDPFSYNELILLPSAQQHSALPYKAQHSYFTCYWDECIQWFAYAGHKWRLSSEEVSEVALKPKAGNLGEETIHLSVAVVVSVPSCLPVPQVPTSTWDGEKIFVWGSWPCHLHIQVSWRGALGKYSPFWVGKH